MSIENRIIYYIQVADVVAVALIPWLKWLAVVSFSALVAYVEWRRSR